MTRAFLVTYRPICRTKAGRLAASRHDLPLFVDGSCRREPDLQAVRPVITALCRVERFAPRLQLGDKVAYITKRGRYGNDRASHWWLVALLQVAVRFESHDSAATWFKNQGSPLPRNCMAPGNPPASLDQTDGHLRRDLRDRLGSMTPEQVVRLWDAAYAARAKRCGVVLVCDVLFRDLQNPPAIMMEDWVQWYGKVPGTQTPPQVSPAVWAQLSMRASGYGRAHR